MGDVRRESAADMLKAARDLYARIESGPDYPGRERFMADARRRIELLEKREMEERESEAEQNQEGHSGE